MPFCIEEVVAVDTRSSPVLSRRRDVPPITTGTFEVDGFDIMDLQMCEMGDLCYERNKGINSHYW